MEEIGANVPPTKLCKDKFETQVVVVTGAGQGIGAATAKLFASQGATVVIFDLHQPSMQTVLHDIEARGGKACFRMCDVGVEMAVNATINEIASTFSRIDVLVHVAGIYPFMSISDCSPADYKQVMNVSMDGCFYLTRAVLPHMQKRGYGRIINTASNTVDAPMAGISAYVAAKSAMIGFTRVTACESGPGVTANVVSPGLIVTEGTLNAHTKLDGSKPLFDMILQRQCVKRYGRPEDVAHAMCFIASPEAQFITGQVFDIGGGLTFH